jgi:hypothetical protein
LALGEDESVDLKDPKWDLGPLRNIFQNVIQKDWVLVFLLLGWGLMDLLDVVDGTGLLGVVPMIVGGFQCMKVHVSPLPLIR